MKHLLDEVRAAATLRIVLSGATSCGTAVSGDLGVVHAACYLV